MPKGILRSDGVSCCACGATSAPPAFNTKPIKKVCKNCWNSFEKECGFRTLKMTPTDIENKFNGWLSHRVILDLKRLHKHGMLGRCEAVSAWELGNRGYQCAKTATILRDGRPVCKRHGIIAKQIIWVNSHETDPYNVVRIILTRLCDADTRIKEILRDAVAAADRGEKPPEPLAERDWLRP